MFGSRRFSKRDARPRFSWSALFTRYRWLLLLLPIYALVVNGAERWPLALVLGGAVIGYNGLISHAAKRRRYWLASRWLYLVPIEMALICFGISLVHSGQTGDFSVFVLPVAVSCFAALALMANRYAITRSTTEQAGSLEELAGQFRILRDAVLILDDRGRIADANPAAVDIFQRRVRDLRGLELRELIQFNSGRSQSFDPVVTPGRARRPQLASGLRPSGEEFLVELTMSRYELTDGSAGATVAIVRDLSDRQRIVELATQRERLATVGEVLARVTHELATPLTGIATLVDDLMATASPIQKSELQMVREESERAGALVHDVLAFVRKDTNKDTVNVNEAVRRALKLSRLRSGGEETQIELDLHPEPIHAVATLGRLQQVVFNLLENARHAVEGKADGKVTVRTDKVGNDVRIEVIDNGRGVPEDLQDQIFEPFFTTKEPGKGTGLGLAIVESIVAEFGGRISLASDGSGATFTLDLQAPARDSVRQFASASVSQ